MWGPGPWMGPMWGFWCGGGRFMCMGPHRHDSEETARLRREVEDLREQMKKQGATHE
jgi:hypothetical protein